jgi:osmoprotectant transport system ATP-binding protein
MITFDGVTKLYGATKAVDTLSLVVQPGELLMLIGASGSGKSTALKLVNRLEDCSMGTIRLDGDDISRIQVDTLRRRMGYAIQSVGLFPHWTVARNIGTVPRLLGWPRAKIAERVRELLLLVQLDPDLIGARFPHQLSGGQQQRVGVARALAADPDVLLMDEPFGALDPITRGVLQTELLRIHRRTGKTIIFVTHDVNEALMLGTRIALLDHGRLVQIGTPLELLASPANAFVRAFLGGDDYGLKLLTVELVSSRVRAGETAPGAPVVASTSLRHALSEMVSRGTDRLAVVDDAGVALGVVGLADLLRA